MRKNKLECFFLESARFGTKSSEVQERLVQEILKGKYHCTIDLLFDWFGLVCFANKNKNCQLSYN